MTLLFLGSLGSSKFIRVMPVAVKDVLSIGRGEGD